MNRITKNIIRYLLRIRPRGFVYFGHGVCNHQKSAYIEHLHITKIQFIKLIHFWKDLGVQFISMEDLLQIRKQNKKYRKPWVHLTFDDGYRNNLTTLLPVMEKYNIPFTVFVTTGLIEKQGYMPTFYIRTAIMHSKKEWECTKTGLRLTRLLDSESRQKLADKLSFYYKYLPHKEGVGYIEEIKNLLCEKEWNHYKSVYSNDQLMCVDELKSLNDSSLVTLGTHSHSHMIFHNRQTQSDVQRELEEPRLWLEDQLGIKADVMAYPNGTKCDYSTDVTINAQKVGYQLAFTTNENLVNRKEEDLLLPRYFLHPKGGGIVKTMLKAVW